MALYIRLFTNFWCNRKTVRLRTMIGDAAFWIPPRLWSYAAENQPNGDFSAYSEDELAMLIGYTSNAQAMLKALVDSGFMDENRVLHDWSEYNGYHKTFSQRAKAAAKVRWDAVKEKERQEIENENEASIAPSNASSTTKQRASEDELRAYCAEVGLPEDDGSWLFDKWEGNGWKNDGRPIKSWKATVRTWKRAGIMNSQKIGINGNCSHHTYRDPHAHMPERFEDSLVASAREGRKKRAIEACREAHPEEWPQILREHGLPENMEIPPA